jgi:hypothetical protein
MKWINTVSCLIALFLLQSAFAEPPVTISAPSPAVPSSYAAGSEHIHLYTITNNVPKSLPITVSGISGPVTRVNLIPGLNVKSIRVCGDTLLAGPYTCSLLIRIAPTLSEEGQSFNQNLTVDYQGRSPLISNIAFSVSTAEPLLGLSTTSQISAISCTGRGATAMCVMVGQNSSHTLFIEQTTNGGATWSEPSIASLPATGKFSTANCTGSGATAICTVAGYSGSMSSPTPFLAFTTNGGAAWTVQ